MTNNNSVGTGTVTLGDGLFQAEGKSDLTFANNFKIDNSASGSAIDANGVSLTIAGNITDGAGSGKLTILGSSFGGGVVTLLGTNTYSGGTTICSCATLVLATPPIPRPSSAKSSMKDSSPSRMPTCLESPR
ncbi:hypothetical protein UP10_39935 [Bradyrhizobium sp. LTSPM299]|uniref:hypothetical protein n=1 Tax=Bradyrhizobium sp. LTSPM299 TaxID=1619233 RepID=UPI0005CA7A45|nr:hypothetical protein [Bradyrhizobium sp. LTSPM299]KJC54924.1 hypothetical protein UP10_39935 [Bradyrhizobium sp. LTSPM299]